LVYTWSSKGAGRIFFSSVVGATRIDFPLGLRTRLRPKPEHFRYFPWFSRLMSLDMFILRPLSSVLVVGSFYICLENATFPCTLPLSLSWFSAFFLPVIYSRCLAQHPIDVRPSWLNFPMSGNLGYSFLILFPPLSPMAYTGFSLKPCHTVDPAELDLSSRPDFIHPASGLYFIWRLPDLLTPA